MVFVECGHASRWILRIIVDERQSFMAQNSSSEVNFQGSGFAIWWLLDSVWSQSPFTFRVSTFSVIIQGHPSASVGMADFEPPNLWNMAAVYCWLKHHDAPRLVDQVTMSWLPSEVSISNLHGDVARILHTTWTFQAACFRFWVALSTPKVRNKIQWFQAGPSNNESWCAGWCPQYVPVMSCRLSKKLSLHLVSFRGVKTGELIPFKSPKIDFKQW